jgi:hypothetical protein
MSEDHLRLVSISVLGGPLHGRRHSPDEVVAEILIGSDPGCHLVVELPGISPIHAKLWADLNESTVYDTSAPRGVYVNTERVTDKARVGDGDVLWLGPPQEPESVCVQCHFEPWVEVLPPPPGTGSDTAAADSLEDSVIIDTASTTLAVTPDMIPSEPPRDDADEAGAPSPALVAGAEAPAVLEVPVEPVEPAEFEEAAEATEPVAPADAAFESPTLAEPAPSPGGEEEPFFIGEEAPVGLPANTGLEAKPALEEEWGVVSEASTGEPAATASSSSDDFFVAGDEEAPAADAPAIVEAEAVVEAEVAEGVPAVAPFLDLPPLEPLAPPPPQPAPPPPPPPPRPAPAPAKPLPPQPERAASPSPPPPPTAPESEVDEQRAAPAAARPSAPVEAPAARPAAPRPQPGAAARRPAGAPSAARPAAPAARKTASTRPAARAAAGGPSWLRPVGLGAAGLLVLAGLGFGVSKLMGGSLRLDAVEPARVRVGQRAVLTGSGFGSDPAAQTVVFGDREARVLQASPKRLEVEVPEAVVAAGAEDRVAVVVRARGRTSGVVDVTVFQGPRLHGISPGAALPGEEVMLAGAGWGVGATVQFGSAPARLLEIQSTQIRAIVPDMPGGPGTQASVVVNVGGVDSNPAPFILGHLPVVSGLEPASAAPGDVVSVAGRGFEIEAARNDVRVGGAPALVIASSNESLQVVIPRLGPGDPSRPVEVRVPGNANVGRGLLQLKPAADLVDFRFVAEPFAPAPGKTHALLATGIGPAFVLAAAGGRTAAERAAVTADRLNAAAQPLRTTVGLTLEARGLESSPVIGLQGRTEALVEVTEEDAAAYNEDWTGLRGRGGPVTRARLARWWEALARDLVLMTIRAQPPQHAAALAPEGRALVQLFETAQRGGAPGVPLRVVEEARPPLRDGLRLLGLRVPASVTAPVPAAAAAPAAALPVVAATPTPPPLQLDGSWSGSQIEQSQRQYLTVSFRGGSGTVAYEGGITFTVPMTGLEKPRRDQVRFSVQIRGGMRHYAGRWDGEAITGTVSSDLAGKNVVATFELRRR